MISLLVDIFLDFALDFVLTLLTVHPCTAVPSGLVREPVKKIYAVLSVSTPTVIMADAA